MKSKVVKIAEANRLQVENFINVKVKRELIVTAKKHPEGIEIISGFDTHLDKAEKLVNEFIKVLEKEQNVGSK